MIETLAKDRVKINDILKKECGYFNTIIDIGCKHGVTLFNCEELGFKKLVGIDKDDSLDKCESYFRYLEEKTKKTRLELLFRIDVFNLKYEFNTLDFRNYPYEQNKYSAIICKFSLHFISDDEKYNLIDTLFNCLEVGGIFYIRLNRNTHPDNIDPMKSNCIAENVYQSIEDGNDTRYLADAEYFLKQMKKYPELKKYRIIDQKSITVVLIK